MKLILATALIGSLAGSRADAQYPRVAARASPALLAVVTPILDSARASGLPTAPLEEKVLEGITKQADAPRIAAALRRLTGELSQARDVLGERATVRQLVAGADALRVGLTPRDLARVRTIRSDRDPAVALELATDLVTQGVPVDTASTLVLSVLVAGVSDGDLQQLRQSVARDVAGGVPPSVAASLRARALVGTERGTEKP